MEKKEPPQLFKLPPAGQAVMPQPFVTPPPDVVEGAAEAIVAGATKHNSKNQQQTWSWSSWWRLNGPLLVLNFGSLATLIGFTRSDVLELRVLSVTGSTTFVAYTMLQPPPIRWPSVFWSMLFSAVNTQKIIAILHERKGNVVLSPRQEEIYNEHFQPHGVTPKQFEKLMSKGKMKVIKSGGLISRQGDEMTTVQLVVKGSTRASVTGRHLTAIGSKPGNRSRFAGGDSGAWIGEMGFLQSLWMKKPIFPVADKDENEEMSDGKGNARAMSTIVAVDDVEIIEWTYEDMNALIHTSGDMQAALTRSMTAAIVGKVANFMMSKQAGMPTVAALIDNWKHGRQIDEDEDDNEDDVEDLPLVRRNETDVKYRYM